MSRTHWVRHSYLFRDDEYECSACRGVFDRAYDVCPSCGAEMGRTKYDPDWVDEMAMLDEIWGDDD